MPAGMLSLAVSLVCWGNHEGLTDWVVGLLPPADQAWLAPEQVALSEQYCCFPDLDWANQGEWGGGNGDPTAPRFPDRRREWDISYYCDWDPVLRTGSRYPHAPPDALDAVAHFYLKALAAYRSGRYEDGTRYAGVMLHYVEDCGSLPHLQPFHRNLKLDDWRPVGKLAYTPVPQATGDDAPAACRARAEWLVTECETALGNLLGDRATVARLREQCAAVTMPPEVVRLMETLRAEQKDGFQALVRTCAEATLRASADVLRTLLNEVTDRQLPEASPPAGTNLIYNPSVEDGQDRAAPDGWAPGWIDLDDRVGRTEWYRRGTHWEPLTHSGMGSLLLLWAPEQGLEWRQSWRRAIRVAPGQRYRLEAWARVQGGEGQATALLAFADTAYHPLAEASAPALDKPTGWTTLTCEATAPEGARWLRVILRSTMRDGAVWFDDLSVTRTDQP